MHATGMIGTTKEVTYNLTGTTYYMRDVLSGDQ